MSSKRKFKRDYIILEAKDMNFRSKERVLPKAFAKIEINDEKSTISLYVENLKNLKDGYEVTLLREDYEKVDLGKINLNSQGKGEFTLDIDEKDSDVKAVALIYDKYIPLIGFKGSKIENYEDLLLEPEEVIEGESNEPVEYDEYEEIEYLEPDSEYNYEEVEYVYEDDLEDEEDEIDETIEAVYEEKADTKINQESDNEECEYEYEEIEYVYEEDDIEDIEPIQEQEEIEEIEEPIISKSKEVQNKKENRKKIVRDEFNNIINTEEEPKKAGKLLMPRQIKKGLKYFKEVKPFAADYIENTRWWKIDINPTTMCGYTMPYLGYVNTLNYTMYSDIAMNSYKYRHYLFGVQYDEYNKRKNYIYAIPGKKNEQPDRGTTGFTFYQPCDNRNNSLGYWVCFIDSRARKILK